MIQMIYVGSDFRNCFFFLFSANWERKLRQPKKTSFLFLPENLCHRAALLSAFIERFLYISGFLRGIPFFCVPQPFGKI